MEITTHNLLGIMITLIVGAPLSYAATSNSNSLDEKESVSTEKILTRNDWKNIINWPQLCDHNVEHLVKHVPDFVGVETYPWREKQRLVSVVCELGAYNRGYMLFLESIPQSTQDKLLEKNKNVVVSVPHYTPLTFLEFGAIEDRPDLNYNKGTDGFDFFQNKTTLLWGKLFIDSNKQAINHTRYYRGGGGCGIYTRYTIDGDKTTVNLLRIKADCDEENTPVSEWTNYPHEVFKTWPVAIKP